VQVAASATAKETAPARRRVCTTKRPSKRPSNPPPPQVQSNALAALEAVDAKMAEEIMAAGCITGDRVNGLCDGVTGDWYCKFDTFHPAVDRGLPVTRVISRVELQQISARYAVQLGGEEVIESSSTVESFEEFTNARGEGRVRVNLADGRSEDFDLLVGADGIWSKIRKEIVGETKVRGWGGGVGGWWLSGAASVAQGVVLQSPAPLANFHLPPPPPPPSARLVHHHNHRQANYSGYTCYTGISDFTPPDIEIVGYRWVGAPAAWGRRGAGGRL